MNKYENPIDRIGVEPSGTEVKTPDLYDNSAFNAVLSRATSERKAAKEKILSGENPMPDFDSLQRKQNQMQERNTLPFQSSNTEIRYSGDPEVTRLHVFSHREDSFEEDETIVGLAIHVDSESEKYAPFNGFYLMKGPGTHNSLRSAVRLEADIQLPMYHDNFADREYIHGFYTNKGNFINRRQAVWLIGENDLPTAVPKSEINSHHGAMSTDIWNEDGSPPKYDSKNTAAGTTTTQRYQAPNGRGGVGHIPVTPIARPKDSKGKVMPKKASELMAEKRIKKMVRKFGM